MIIGLLAATLVVALAVSGLAAWLFVGPIRRIMERIVPDAIGQAWVRYIIFAVYVVGIAGGVGIRRIERYVTPVDPEGTALVLTGERWVLELYSTVIGSLAAIAWTLLIFFVFALLAYVGVRALELKREGDAPGP